MKRIVYLLVVLIAMAGFSAKAQMRWGAIAGATITDLKWSQSTFRTQPFVVDQSVGGFGGVIGEYNIPGIGFAIDLGLQYAQRGATLHLEDFKVWSDDGFGEEKALLHYIDIPVHLRFKYQRMNGFERKLAPFVFAGPTMSILAGHSNIKAFDYKSVILGIELGAGVEIFRNYQLSACYTWDVTNTMQAVKLDNFKSKSRTWKVGLTYLF